MLIAAGAMVSAADKFGCTPLHYAARAGHLPIIKKLLDAAADPHATNKHGKTPLQVAHDDVQIFLHALDKASSGTQDDDSTRPPPTPLVAVQPASPQPIPVPPKPVVERAAAGPAGAAKTSSRSPSKPASNVKSISSGAVPAEPPSWSVRLTKAPDRFSAPAPVEDKLLEIGSFALPELSPRIRDARVKSTYGTIISS